jgi:hypothetical protein
MAKAIVPIVEGQSEVVSIPILLRRLLHRSGHYELEVARPFRVKRNRVVRPGELEKALVLATRSRPGAAAVVVVLDADDDCAELVDLELAQERCPSFARFVRRFTSLARQLA